MKPIIVYRLLFITVLLIIGNTCLLFAQKQKSTGVLVIGGGTGGTAAGIQSAKMGVNTIIVEPTQWLGGMLSSAGVPAFDGNHNMPSGLWANFRERVYKVYGGAAKVATGWVSNTLFEPHVGDSILKAMAAEQKQLIVLYQWRFEKVLIKDKKILGAIFTNNKHEQLQINATIVIDATELGDVMANAKIPYSLGMEADSIAKENIGITTSNNVIQDLTYVAILKDYGSSADCTIAKPQGYNPMEFDGACTDYYINKNIKAPTVNAKKMLDYGKLPNNKYMLNWPAKGNDTYLNIVEKSETERVKELEKAKQTTLRFIYFIQHQLGFKNLGFADDEFYTNDKLAVIPYYREGRRLKGLVRLNSNDIAHPFTTDNPLYRTGISVGDYPIDHHHNKNSLVANKLNFLAIPSFNVPLGALIPKDFTGIIVAEKAISVSNVVNGTTRLQPCVMLTGQAVGVLAALSIKQKKNPSQIDVRQVQQVLLDAKAYIMPYYDVKPSHQHFEAIQKIGATGILKGVGQSYLWANRTWFYPDSLVNTEAFIKDIAPFIQLTNNDFQSTFLTIGEAIDVVQLIIKSNPDYFKDSQYFFSAKALVLEYVAQQWLLWQFKNFDTSRAITREELAVLLNAFVNPFQLKQVNHLGHFKTKRALLNHQIPFVYEKNNNAVPTTVFCDWQYIRAKN